MPNEERPLFEINSPGEMSKEVLSRAGVSYDDDNAVEKEFQIQSLAALVGSKVQEAVTNRSTMESQWFKNVQSFRAEDTPGNELRSETELSKIYLRTTTVKTRAAFAQLTEAVLSDTRFPIEITSSIVPEGASKFAHLGEDAITPEEAPEEEFDSQEDFGLVNALDIGFEGDGQSLAPGASIGNISFLGGLEGEAEPVGIVEGPSRTGTPQISPSKEAARKMDSLIQDQLTSSKARIEFRKTLFEMCVLGIGAMKGPFNVNKRSHSWEANEDTGKMEYRPFDRKCPETSFVSMWNLFVDPSAEYVEDAEWIAEKHSMTHRKVAELKRRPHFDEEAIDEILAAGPNYTQGNYESQLKSNTAANETQGLFEIWEYWGYMSVADVRDHGLEVPESADDMVQVNMWYSGTRVLRLTLNPFLPARIPYYVIPYEEKPYQLNGTGVPEAMEDSQSMINGFARMAVENAALAGNLVFDVDESALVPGEDMTIYPGKVFKRQAGSQGQAVHAINFPNTAPANLQIMQSFRQHADEATGIPSIAHGQTGVQGYGRTASGMSMLLNNSSLNIKTVIRNIDDYLLRPLGEAYFNWNMQFNSKDMPEVVGDLEVVAKGSSSLQMKEVRSQRLQTFLQISANPGLAPLVKLPTILKELAISMDLDPDEILNNPEEAQVYAALMGSQGMQQPQQGQGNPMAGGPEEAPLPGSQGFSGNNVSEGGALEVGNAGEGM
jgi:hypothetical protein